jgi:tripartite ATP-independent transporter DctP family solute receptor
MSQQKRFFLMTAVVVVLSAAAVIGFAQPGKETQGGAEEKKVVLRVGGIQSAEDAASQGMELLAKLAKEKSGGSLEIQVFPASQLGNAISQIEAVSLGSQDMFIDASGFLAQFVPDKNVETLFFTFKNENHFKKYLAGDINKRMEADFLSKKGARIISNNWLRAPRVFASKREIRTLNDMQGLKMRVPEIKGYLESVAALGARPTQIAWGEVYLALTQGVVDACEGPKDTMYTMKFFESTKRIIITNHIMDNLVLMINENRFSKLSQAQKDALISASNEAGDWYTKTIKERVNGFYAEMEKMGVSIYEINTSAMMEKMKEAAVKLEAGGMWRSGLYQAIQALAN